MRAQLDSFFVTVPSERAYLAATEDQWVQPHLFSPPRPRELARIGTFPRSRARELSQAAEWPYGKRHVAVEAAAVCPCCGRSRFQTTLIEVTAGVIGEARQWRCERHVGRNPCAVEGCGRTRAGKRPLIGWALCWDHFRMVPRRMRDVERRLWRLQRKSGGWTDTLLARYWRVWPRLVDAAQRVARGEGDLDLAEIEREFGAL